MFTIGDVLRHKAETQTAKKQFTIVEHIGIADAGMYLERHSTDCPHTASKQFDRFKFNSNPLTVSLALFEGEELKEFWSPEAL
jgi:hypothetical protein